MTSNVSRHATISDDMIVSRTGVEMDNGGRAILTGTHGHILEILYMFSMVYASIRITGFGDWSISQDLLGNEVMTPPSRGKHVGLCE